MRAGVRGQARGVIALLLLVLLIVPRTVLAQAFQSPAPHAILLDYETGSVLYERAADELVSPASLAKLMTIEVVFNQLRQGRLSLESEVTISENAWRRGGAPSGGSTMFAALGSRIRVIDLIPGIVVLSGNDASIAIAEAIAGDEATFARLMTERARVLGLRQSTFRNATGMLDPDQKTTIRELAQLCVHLIRTYPEYYAFFGLKDFTWNKVKQSNRNPLLAMDIGADGIKTGNIEDSGFSLAGSAVQDGRRLVVVVSGLKSARDRAIESRKLLEWGFRSFEMKTLFDAKQPIAGVSVFGGTKSEVQVAALEPVRALVPRGAPERVSAEIVYRGPLRAPVKAGDQVGTLQVMRGSIKAVEVPVIATEDVAVGSLHERAFQSLWQWAGDYVRSKLRKS